MGIVCITSIHGFECRLRDAPNADSAQKPDLRIPPQLGAGLEEKMTSDRTYG